LKNPVFRCSFGNEDVTVSVVCMFGRLQAHAVCTRGQWQMSV
jgi:hypothetical protein